MTNSIGRDATTPDPGTFVHPVSPAAERAGALMSPAHRDRVHQAAHDRRNADGAWAQSDKQAIEAAREIAAASAAAPNLARVAREALAEAGLTGGDGPGRFYVRHNEYGGIAESVPANEFLAMVDSARAKGWRIEFDDRGADAWSPLTGDYRRYVLVEFP